MPASADRFLERALLFTFVIHGVAMIAMVLWLLPGMPGGGTADDLTRIHYIAEHPWLWRLGWLPWQLTALSDALLAIGLLRARWIPKFPAAITAALTLAAVIPDQAGQIAWMTHGIALAQSGDATAYLAYEARIFAWTAVWGASLYTLGALGWTCCLIAGRTWNRTLSLLSIVLWPLFLVISAGPLLPPHLRPSPAFVAAGNAIGFLLMELWFALVAELVLRRSRPTTATGRYAPWRHPRPWLGRLLDPIANSRFVRALAEILPVPALVSDVSKVLFVNYLVEAERLLPLVPAGLDLQRVGPNGRYAIFSFLNIRHGHFGPRLLGPLRRLLPSPLQSNWRIHVRDPRTGLNGIHFVTNAIDSTLHALTARLLTEGMPMHVWSRAEMRADGNGDTLTLVLDPGTGSAPDAHGSFEKMPAPPVTGPWTDAFASWQDMLSTITRQDRAFSAQPWHRHITRQEIELDLPLETCVPLAGSVSSHTAAAIIGDATPFCFLAENVQLRFIRETHDPLTAGGSRTAAVVRSSRGGLRC